MGVTETCGVCGDDLSVSQSVHVTVNTKSDAGVVDYYVCRPCYERELEGLFA
ncbi:MAG: hypothetical protein ABEJ88_01500 [Halobacterium sp.]